MAANGEDDTFEEIDLDTRLRAVKREIDEVDLELARLTKRRKTLEQLREKYRLQKQQQSSNQLAQKDWDTDDFSWSPKVDRVLKEVFHMKSFRAQQLGAINAVLSKHDVLLLAPTGGGKSLCYQLPALVAEGITLIVSPLIALMEDQIWALKKIGVKAEYLSATMDKDVVNSVHKHLRDGDYESLRLVYITPERVAKSNRFMSALQKCYNSKKLALIAIDEVHCCSQWGHDYRPDYKLLGVFKKMFPDVPIIGVTATATAKVISDVQKMLNLRECLILNAPFNRPNLYYHILEKPADKEELYDMLEDLLHRKYRHMSGIIYTFSVKETEEISTQLLQRNIKVLPYHAYLESKQRSKTYQKWMGNEIQAVVATIAFGMGIDKADVRFVIHHTMSKSMENFYQESGRAGRDGKRADCILLYRFMDIFRLSTMSFQEYEGLSNLYSMVKYCINGNDCRRLLISRHFAEVWDDTHCNRLCDRCYFRDKAQLPEQDITPHYQTLLAILRRAETLQTKLTALKLVDAWYHKGSPKNRLETPPPLMDRYIGEQIVAFLIVNDFLKEEFQYNVYTTLSYIVKGSNFAPDSGIRFRPARVLRVPKDSLKSTMSNRRREPASDEDISFVSESGGASDGNSSKRRVSESGESTVTTNEHTSTDSVPGKDGGRSNGMKRRKKTTSTNPFESLKTEELDVEKRLSDIIEKEMDTRDKDNSQNEDEDVMFVPLNDEIIEIDEL
ncbi:ATP-dependent DNA helicase Q1-like [Toxorhynchites rutilus septentrionalis]|uniref:ATP-dependent DNA helicase Q1-like n=1 Tax=Toxorhynchites rutilus septentrionalis TaxID=329112 RepID=UPI00247AFD3F|nr:ATP-dependent DNA helicase Q1-like [Toxorhynchites rutilus septentrionalis]